ncbi:MAG: hypothetical protein QOE93_1289 [Actinomycetota bacterium]|jgi:hypothetical protein|nr:hypothetical protein [Actinomycetota bacterium]
MGAATVPGVLDDLERWAAGARAQEAAEARVRERWLRQAAEEEASFAGLLVDMAEDGRPVSVTTTAGRRHHGPIAAVGQDFVAVVGPEGRLILVCLAAVAEVRPTAGSRRPPAANGRQPLGVTLAEVLAQAVANRPRVGIVLGEVTVVGELRAVGTDVLTVRTDGEPGAVSYVTLASVSEVSLFDSG